MEEKKERSFEYRDNRFEFIVYLNNFIIAKRNFGIQNYIEKSMHTEEFSEAFNSIYKMIDNDLKSKSMIYMWYNVWDGEFSCLTENELLGDLQEPWETTFKIVVTDRGREVASRIWDGRYYPKFIKDKVDLTNKWVRITNKEGKVETYDKESFFADNDENMSPKMAMIKDMIYLKDDVLYKIIDKIADTCSRKEKKSGMQRITDFSTTLKYGDKEYTTDLKKYNNKLAENWSKEKNFKRQR